MTDNLVLLTVLGTGEVNQITGDDPASAHMKTDQVLIVIDDEQKRIFIWKGVDAPVRKKFIAARSAQRIRDSRGLVYKIVSEDAGEEDEGFLQVMSQAPTSHPDAAAFAFGILG